MQVVNFSEFRNHLKTSLDSVTDDNDIIIINRNEGRNAVLISLKEYNSIQETLYLMSTENNRKKLMDAIERDKANIYETHDLIEG